MAMKFLRMLLSFFILHCKGRHVGRPFLPDVGMYSYPGRAEQAGAIPNDYTGSTSMRTPVCQQAGMHCMAFLMAVRSFPVRDRTRRYLLRILLMTSS